MSVSGWKGLLAHFRLVRVSRLHLEYARLYNDDREAHSYLGDGYDEEPVWESTSTSREER